MQHNEGPFALNGHTVGVGHGVLSDVELRDDVHVEDAAGLHVDGVVWCGGWMVGWLSLSQGGV